MIGIALLCPCFVVLDPFGMVGKWLIKLPHTHDPLLVGAWEGTWRFMDDPKAKHMVTTFNPNGSGDTVNDGRLRYSFLWGTEDGVLYTRRMAVDAWSGTHHAYRLSNDSTSAAFEGVRMFDLVVAKMKRK